MASPVSLVTGLCNVVAGVYINVHLGVLGMDASDVEEIAGTIYEFLGEEPLQVEVDIEEAVDAALTSRETEVLALVASGHSNKEIAQQLSISVHTVQRHVANIYNKIGARGRADATAYALKHRLL